MAHVKCAKPISVNGVVVGCGQCHPCRFNTRRMWTTRILLEAGEYEHNSFITLTYDEERLPPDGSLVLQHLQLFLKRLRKSYEPKRFRFYAVGEYGENFRPHYHVAAFGYPTCLHGRTRKQRIKQFGFCCEICSKVADKWANGYVYLGALTEHSAQYIAGYVTKKLTHRLDPRLEGKAPEFSTKSLKPGLGLAAMHDVADGFLKVHLDTTQGDVPSSLRFGAREMPIGRYLKNNLRQMTGMDTDEVKQFAKDQQEKTLLPLREAAKKDEDAPSVVQQFEKENAQAVKNFNARQAIFKQRKTL